MSSFLRDNQPIRSRFSAHRQLPLLFLLLGLHSGLYHSVRVDGLTGVYLLIGEGKPKAEDAKCVASCRFGVSINRNAAMDPRSNQVRVPCAFASLIPYQIPRAPSSLTLLSQDSRNASVDMRIGPIAVIRTLRTPINCMVRFFIAL